jgi:hypothetical protein
VRTVHKYVLSAPVVELHMPRGARLLTVATQGGKPCLWAEVDLRQEDEVRTFANHGTGHPIPDDETYIGTAHNVEGMGLVFHIFERGPVPA